MGIYRRLMHEELRYRSVRPAVYGVRPVVSVAERRARYRELLRKDAAYAALYAAKYLGGESA